MREIEFRGLKLDGTGWLYWNILDGFSDPKSIIDSETIGQYIGLNDKKSGKKVYEKDIVKALEYYNGRQRIGVVNFTHSTVVLNNNDNSSWIIHFHDFEVIGNIYENPELLKQK